MKRFMGRNFLLDTETARDLFHRCAADLPIIDYHCHISPKEIWENRAFTNPTELWLEGDHYKWRIMRASGIEETYITGDASDFEKFQKYAEALEKAIGNPLYHFSHLELQRYFGYTGVLHHQTAGTVYSYCMDRIAEEGCSVRDLIRGSHVEVICTTDDPADDLRYHELIAEDPSIDFKVYPAWRPDQILNLDKDGFPAYIEKLGNAAGVRITDLGSLLSALEKRMDLFADHGCRISDHGLYRIVYREGTEEEADRILKKRLQQETVTREETETVQTYLMKELGAAYHDRGWVMQLHYGCQRNINTRAFKALGPDTGFDAMHDESSAEPLAAFLNSLEIRDKLPKTIVYSLNPSDDPVIETILGCFQAPGPVQKMQHGAAWWFNDHRPGIEAQLRSFASTGVLGNFIGMLTDSRSFLSYARHEYFRRILCNFIGELAEHGEYPDDPDALRRIIEGISYENAKKYFGF